MSFTRIDSHFFRGEAASYDTSSFIGLNPDKQPGSFVFAGATAARESLGGQVACKLALEQFVDGVLEYFNSLDQVGCVGDKEISVNVLETAFRRANTSVYQFGHSLAAGGRMAASLLGLVVEKNVVAAGRVGFGSAYLVRDGEAFPFFEAQQPGELMRSRSSFIGANSLVQVELSSIPIAEKDILVLFSDSLDPDKERVLGTFLAEYDFREGQPCEDLCQYLFPDMIELSYAMVARIGPDTIYLSEVIDDKPAQQAI